MKNAQWYIYHPSSGTCIVADECFMVQTDSIDPENACKMLYLNETRHGDCIPMDGMPMPIRYRDRFGEMRKTK